MNLIYGWVQIKIWFILQLSSVLCITSAAVCVFGLFWSWCQCSATKSASHLSSTHPSLTSSNPSAHEASLHSATASYSTTMTWLLSSINSSKYSPPIDFSYFLLFLSPVHPPSCWLAPCSNFVVSSWWVSASIVEGRSWQVQAIQVN